MADAHEANKTSLSATLWSLLIIVCLLLVVAHLATAVRHDTSSEEDLVQGTFTTVKPVVP